MRRRHMAALLDARARSHALLPRLEMRELIDIHVRPTSGRHPAPVRDVRDGNVVTDQIPGLGGGEVLVEHAVETACLVDVPVHTVLDVLGGVADEVVRLALHGSDAGILEVQPADGLVVLAGAPGVGDLVVLVVLLGQIGEDAAGLEEPDLLAVGECIG